MKDIILNNGLAIPQIGFGTYKSTLNGGGSKVILEAIRAGYRHLDTAALYENEEEVGEAVVQSGIARSEFYLTSKLNRNFLGYDSARSELEKTLKKLKTDYLDLYLIHWPRADYGTEGFDAWEYQDKETWRALEEMVQEGKIRSIGVSNFLPHHLDNLLSDAKIVPAVNQLELHPGYLQEEAVDYSRSKGIEIEAWSPIGRARIMNNPTLLKIAADHGASVAGVALAFCLQMGFIILPKTTDPGRMQQNLKADELKLSEAEMDTIKKMPLAGWSGEHPDRQTVAAVCD